VILGDTMGEMHTYYNLAHFIILGGSINNYGSQNPIEGLSLNKPLAIGRSIFNFKSIIEEGTKAGIFYRFSKLDDLTAHY
jgi:3-deoxy-D-manno-octulosonic-acid transferase